MGRYKRVIKHKKRNMAMLSLFLIFIILLVQSALLMFVGGASSPELAQLDTVFRTTLSSIFGFFMSSTAIGMVDSNSETQSEPIKTIGFASQPSQDAPTAKGATDNDAKSQASEGDIGEVNTSSSPKVTARFVNNWQIIVLTSVCLFCLIAMIAVRYFSFLITDGDNAMVTLSLYRDFISGSVGAITGLARSNN